MAEARTLQRVALGGALLALFATPLLAQYKAPAPGIGAAPLITPNPGGALTAPSLKVTPLPSAPKLAVPSAPSLSAPAAPPVAAPSAPAAAAAPTAASRPAPMQAGRRLLKVATWGGRSAGSCDITERLRSSWCVGNRCRLACPSNPCGGEESGCQFILECATEIVASIAVGEQPCRDVQVMMTVPTSGGGQIVRQQVWVRAGMECEPPPCMPPR
jgi:hypothetical protein